MSRFCLYGALALSSKMAATTFFPVAALSLAFALNAGQAKAEVTKCSRDFVAKVREPASDKDGEVKVNCNLTLNPSDTITKKLVLEGPAATGVRIACRGALLAGGRHNQHGASLEIHSRRRGSKDAPTWQRPENIIVQDCRIEGGIRIWGMADGGRDQFARPSSHKPGHTERARNAAPRHIRLQRLFLRATGAIPLYISPGVTGLSLTNSMLTGESNSVAIYMDAESGHNVLRNNVIAVRTSRRELIAIDGSSDNLLVNNLLLPGEHGGIYLYRNCGERGTVRHNRPERNRIVNNVFMYEDDQWDDPAIFIGSRDGSPWYCDEDDGYPFGSSASDLDFARYNVVLQNRFIHRPVPEAIRVGNPQSDRPNTLLANETVHDFHSRPAGCYLTGHGSQAWVKHGQHITQGVARGASDVCVEQRCEDGVLHNVGSCTLTRVNFECRSTSVRRDCSTSATCPAGTQPLTAMAACDLHDASVSTAEVLALTPGQLVVYRGTGTTSPGTCQVGTTLESQRRQVIRFQAERNLPAKIPIRCQAPSNGKGCEVRGTLLCQPSH